MNLKKSICGATIFFCIIAHIILGYCMKTFCGSNDGYWYGFLFYILVPAMPFLVGLKKVHISYEFAMLVIYITVCLSVQLSTKNYENGPILLWHPLWVIFLTIPIYHIFSKHMHKTDN